MLKVSGALLVFFAGWGMGNWRSRQYQQRIKDLQILQLIISCLIGEISYARNTLPEAFSRISEKVASPFREYLQSVAKRLKEQTGEAFVRILKEQEQTVREKNQSPGRRLGPVFTDPRASWISGCKDADTAS